jgi:hypothetical protein
VTGKINLALSVGEPTAKYQRANEAMQGDIRE